MKKSLICIFFLMVSSLIFSQEHISSFNAVTVTYQFHPKFFIYGEGQLRGIENYSYPDYYEIKGGIGYNLTPNHKPFVGIGRYATYKNHSLDKEEFRIWLQDVLIFKYHTLKFENRFRAEKSWFYEPNQDLHSDRYRFRYRLNISVPLNSKSITPGTIFANAYSEIFFVTEKPIFARNRLYGGFGYQVDEIFGLASGYLWQREFGNAGNKNLHFLYLALNINIDDSQQKHYHFPGAD
ncbi:DUF2490 domain-containing protein [Chryseobacterium koreense]|uniref:DUF2490 domain-containing protein n=1 Tax=Chryseobacterium koreense CCUG 49689 TaxID=1304281 RepID=A0A0J7IYN0_9FLAO|nr:DUF2490 domain-containing protein [Chryseobacterium koreense]KMQ70941.1 hypothetical protein ACM44_10015 [Chryseobacterium koreense CCUG 49689]MBB5332395.1 hypothetical protein [Chryseobacterium koreense]